MSKRQSEPITTQKTFRSPKCPKSMSTRKPMTTSNHSRSVVKINNKLTQQIEIYVHFKSLKTKVNWQSTIKDIFKHKQRSDQEIEMRLNLLYKVYKESNETIKLYISKGYKNAKPKEKDIKNMNTFKRFITTYNQYQSKFKV